MEDYKVKQEAMEIPVYAKVDVLVCGGGPTGIGAAISAAKTKSKYGCSVLVIEKENCLGGMATSGLVTNMVANSMFTGGKEQADQLGIKNYNPKNRRRIIKGVCEEFINLLVENKGGNDPDEYIYKGWGDSDGVYFDPEIYKRVAEEFLLSYHVNLLYHTMIVDVIMDGDTIKGVVIENKAGRQAILAGIVIDATGDGDVAVRAGAEYMRGREEDGRDDSTSMLFRMGGFPPLEEVEDEIRRKFPVSQLNRGIQMWRDPKISYGNFLMFPTVNKGEWRAEMTRVFGNVLAEPEALTNAEIQGRRQVKEILDYVHENYPKGENVYLIDTGHTTGFQGTRRIKGEYVFTKEDLLNCTEFDDAIALGAYPIDIHNPMGPGFDMVYPKKYRQAYAIPYRCLVPIKIDNMLVAGKCMSCDFTAKTATQVQALCMATGEAAGAAAAMCIADKGLRPRDVNIKMLRDILLSQGVCLEQIVEPYQENDDVSDIPKMENQFSDNKEKITESVTQNQKKKNKK